MKCPRCHNGYVEHPAISRRDNKTKICPRCGEEEAMIDAGIENSNEAFIRDSKFGAGLAQEMLKEQDK